jgi:hypothetical protein
MRLPVARRHPHGSFAGTSSIELGLHREIVERLEALRQASRAPARLGRLVFGRGVVASLHWPARPTRDTVLDDGVGAT